LLHAPPSFLLYRELCAGDEEGEERATAQASGRKNYGSIYY